MQRRTCGLIVGLGLLVGALSIAIAAPSTTSVTYQGVLTRHENGVERPVVDAPYQLIFKIWSTALPTPNQTPLQTITQTVSTREGFFTASLSVNPEVLNGEDRWWSVTFEGTEMLPRQQVTAAPYAVAVRGITVDGRGYAGVGTSQPGFRFHVRQSEEGEYAAVIDNPHPRGQGLLIRASDGGGPWRLLRVADSNNSVRFEVDANGKATTHVLEILGGSDLAEPVPLTLKPGQECRPGMVLSIDPDVPGGFMIASESYDTKIAGIVSGGNGVPTGLLMANGSDPMTGWGPERVPLAMAGRVWAVADESAGEIVPGARLTSSGKALGHVMAATDPDRVNGTVVGKAMTRVDPKTRMVLVLLDLQ